ncbi:hypothetical protein CYFUS_001585 [Cystobacter fuscus]|uniref:Uncharacterized protein n=1 Tax=Cystobacter fuscus TaxID=43 RepID=A0A250IYC4_9BACT|nr:hypothetical protein CYFUS_001585 [Cystobacter fuscus]
MSVIKHEISSSDAQALRAMFAGAPKPVVLYLHGGGYVRRLAQRRRRWRCRTRR